MRIRIPLAVCLAAAAVQAAHAGDLFQSIRANNLPAMRRQLTAGQTAGARDSHGTPALLYAAAFGSAEAVHLLLESGADPNARNGLDATPLLWAAADLAKLRLLLAHGAGPNAHSRLGRTPLMVAAACDGCSENVRLLLQKGAAVEARDTAGTTALALAALAGDLQSLRLLLAHGADARAASHSGLTPLMLALQNCSAPAAAALLAHGADVNAANTSGGTVRFGAIELVRLTPLHFAAPYCGVEVLQPLLNAGAHPDAADIRGMTPLMLAVSSEHQDPAVVRLLIQAGAAPNALSKAGETPLDWARKYGDPAVIAALQQAGAHDGPFTRAQFHFGQPPERPPAAPGTPAPRDAAAAVQSATALLNQGATQFFQQSGCVGCHHQVFASLASSAARAAGVPVDREAAASFLKMMEAELTPQKEPLMERIDPGGLADTACYMLQALAAARYPAGPVTDTGAVYIAALQHRAGNWHTGDASRSPLQEGDIARTARCLHALAVYAPPARQPEFHRRVAQARAWLAEAHPSTNDDFAMRLAGLAWAAADPLQVAAAARALTARQRDDGGWSQNPNLASDPFATGESLWSLAESAAATPASPPYRRGVRFLLDRQWPDGSWYVRSRAPQFQPYFQSGFPFDHDQWVSSAGTAWAVMALAPAIEKPQASPANRP
ncbi:MAG TPA: ankyrin repeat domain-containing protein [Bryobacteraceae bacterium]|nr:ankyrin repeat domain-containing protein [Bryobacteraceae bacterium]